MNLATFRAGLFRDLISAIFLAIALLAGVVDSRSATEKAAAKGFAGTFELCLQSAHGSAGSLHDEHCDACRVPAHGFYPAVAVVGRPVAARVAEQSVPVASPINPTGGVILPEARGPPIGS